ncbi:protein P21-like [Andrographis paniculata]|uniref:protein P21-like n=1 Tax=Andrographis paniculata TaxID=175694 RepID=UPI0021E70C1F|nr:protein P21-like [Andrographis paniculata]
MDSLSIISRSILLLIVISCISGGGAATKFTVKSNCPNPVWAAATPVGGGRQLNRGDVWEIDIPPGTPSGRVWGRTGCNFDPNGNGRCETGDCGGVLQCVNSGEKPFTIAEFTLGPAGGQDSYDVSLVDGFNLGMEFAGDSDGCNQRTLRCTADIVGQCPAQLKAGNNACKDPCTAFGRDEYCCPEGSTVPCVPTDYSKFFKERCPDAYSYPKDDTATKSCPAGTNYSVTFCP